MKDYYFEQSPRAKTFYIPCLDEQVHKSASFHSSHNEQAIVETYNVYEVEPSVTTSQMIQ